MLSNYSAMVSHNFDLIEKSDKYVNTDGLTLLYNHRGFQEILTDELQRAEINKLIDKSNFCVIIGPLKNFKGYYVHS